MEYQLTNNNDELQHYGVLGMKWGVRRGNYAKAYSKGVKKLKKLDSKSNKYTLRSDRLSYKASRAYARGNDKKYHKLEVKARRLKYSSTKLERKGQKFYKKMEKTFAEVDVKNLNKEDVEYGQRYAARVLS